VQRRHRIEQRGWIRRWIRWRQWRRVELQLRLELGIGWRKRQLGRGLGWRKRRKRLGVGLGRLVGIEWR
jgi:hypothetical protein